MENKKIEFIGYLSETKDPIVFTKDEGSRAIIEMSKNESVATLHLSTMRHHRIKFTAECLPNEHERVTGKETRKENRKKARAIP